jgi:transcriptional regulator with XRE-family HTH domain
MKIGEYIKEVRISKGVTQTELSEKSGIAVRTIQRIENSEVTPSIYSLNAIGAALDVKLNEVPNAANDGKFEFKIVISNFSNLFVDIKTLIKRNMKTLLVIVTVTFGLLSFKDLKSLFFNLTDNTTISVSTINCGTKNECDIELVRKDVKGKVLWKRIIGGTSYDKAGQVNRTKDRSYYDNSGLVVRTKDGNYIVVGSTSSFGKGNYDVLVAKVSSKGEILWQKTYGEFLNDYGLRISAVKDNLYQIEATKQICATFNVSNDCFDQEWLFKIDENGIVK